MYNISKISIQSIYKTYKFIFPNIYILFPAYYIQNKLEMFFKIFKNIKIWTTLLEVFLCIKIQLYKINK